MAADRVPQIVYSEDPAWVLAEARDFLRSDPVQHNLILSLLHSRAEHPEPGRYWLAKRGERVAGVAFQSPLHFYATVTPMAADLVSATVDAITGADVDLPGVSGEAATAARFAGQWTERTKSAAVPLQGQRIYEAADVHKPANVRGRIRQAALEDRALVLKWLRAFHDDIGQHGIDPTANVDRRLPAGLYRLWEDGVPVSMAMHTRPMAGVSRIGAVYTPEASRRHGYAAACVAALTEQLFARGLRCILYTDLGNPVSNSIYRRIGYTAVAENLLFRFT